MKQMHPEFLNSLIHDIYCSNTGRFLDKNTFKEETIAISFWDFIKSQLNYKIVDIDYKSLLVSAVTLKDIVAYNNVLDVLALQKISVIYSKFLEIFSVLGISMHYSDLTCFKLIVPDQLYQQGKSTSEPDYLLGIFNDWETVESEYLYVDILRKYNISVAVNRSIDFRYLSKMLYYYNCSQEKLIVIEEDI